ncbi:MAG: FAD-dependent oxidoreductase [Actinomycetota bacterium]|nr:FAD-dependent oxidoreductase [Actinomycetota bacterium]
MPRRLAVIGGDAGGMSAAAVAKRREPELDVVVFERGSYTSYSACGIPFHVGGEVDPLETLVARSPEKHRVNGLDVRMGAEVVAVDLTARRLTLAGSGSEVGFDELLIATGAHATPPPIPGIETAEAARTLESAGRLRSAVDAGSDGSAVVIGGGYIGLEIAEAFVRQGLHTTLVDVADQVFGGLDAEMAGRVQEAAEGLGIDVQLGTQVEEVLLDGDDRPRAVRTDRGEVPARHVVVATGVKPEVGVAEAAGLTVGESGGLAVDDHQRAAGQDGVWVAGDCSESHHRLLGRAVNVQLGTHANKQGRVAGTNLTGGDLAFPGVLGTAITRICALEIALTGLSEREARAEGLDYVAETVETDSRARYMPDSARMWVKLVVERGSGRLLGAQVVGGATAGKRIDTLAMALWTGMDVEALQWVDLSYAPPVSGTLDPVLVAARATAKLV